MKYFKYLDFPKDNISFLIQSKGNLRISLGGILNTAILIMAITLFRIFASDMINKENPSIFIQSVIDQDNRTINMNQSLINVVIQPYYSINGVSFYEMDFSLITVKGYNASYTTYVNGTKTNFFDPFPMKPCEEKDFDESQIEFFRKNNFAKTAYCMAIKEFEIKGQFTSSIFKFLNFRVEECDGIDLKTGLKITCKSKSERDALIGKYRMSAFFTYTMPDLKNLEKPYSSQVFNLAYSFNALTASKDNFFFSSDLLYSDDNLFSSGKDFDLNNKPYEITNFSNLQASLANVNSFVKETYVSMYYRISPSYNYIKRTYKKIPEVFAQTLPFIQISILISQILVSPFRDHSLYSEIIREAFKHKTEKYQSNIKKLKKESEEKYSISNTSVKNFNIDVLKHSETNRFHKYQKKFNNLNSESNNLKVFTIRDQEKDQVLQNSNKNQTRYIPYLMKKNTKTRDSDLKFNTNIFSLIFSKKKENDYYTLLKKKIMKAIEINTYLSLFNNIEKLEILLLNESQKMILPLWNYDYYIDNKGNVTSNWLNFRNKVDAETLSFYNDIKQNNQKSKLDLKLMSNINLINDEEILN
jgi:hypothetical protein